MKFLLRLLVLLWFLTAASANSAAINHTFVEQNTPQTLATSFTDIPGSTISSAFFSAGKKYLIQVTAQTKEPNGGGDQQLRLVHGSTVFSGSASAPRNQPNHAYTYHYFTVWTAVGGEDVKLQGNDPAGDATVDQIGMFAMNLSDDLTENTDWFYNESTASTGLTTTPQDGGSITFTPVAGHDWLVLSGMTATFGGTADSIISRLQRSGEASSTSPQWRVLDGFSSSAVIVTATARTFGLGASSNTFKEQASMISGTAGTRSRSAVFALDLNKFRNHAVAYTDADSGLAAGGFNTQLQTLTIVPDVSSNVWIGAYWGFDINNNGRTAPFRVQVDNTDQPSGQTADNYQFHYGDSNDDETPLSLVAMVSSMSAASHSIDLDVGVDDAGNSSTGQHRQLWAVTMELASVGGGGGTTSFFRRRAQ